MEFAKSIIVILSLATIFTSCLKKGLDTFPNWNQNDINNVYVEYRYNGTTQYNGQPVVEYKRLTVNQTIDKVNKTANITIAIPAASGSFTAAVKNAITQSNIIPYFDVSTAASMEGVEGTPNPGNVSDMTKTLKYKVTAANGTAVVWTINVTSFTK